MTKLFQPFRVRDVEIPNRIMVSPMCQYSSDDGYASDWHLVHLGARAVGGAGIVMLESSAITPEGRISPQDLGIWKDEHCEMLSRIARFIREQGSVPAIQIAHAGRKASQRRPWEGGGPLQPDEGPWETVAPSAIPFDHDWHTPRELTIPEIEKTIRDYADATRRSRECGFDIVEVHAAHGYLLNEFLCSASNKRTDSYGGSFDNRIRLALEVVDAVRSEWPESKPLFVRVSATDWSPGGWDVADTVRFVEALATRGVDVIDVSSGGNIAGVTVPNHDDYQVSLAGDVRSASGIPTVAVGRITTPEMAERVLAKEWADIVALGREFLRSPQWPMHAASVLGSEIVWPDQYLRARLD